MTPGDPLTVHWVFTGIVALFLVFGIFVTAKKAWPWYGAALSSAAAGLVIRQADGFYAIIWAILMLTFLGIGCFLHDN